MTGWREFVDFLDDSHPMTTDRKHIRMLCEAVEGKEWWSRLTYRFSQA